MKQLEPIVKTIGENTFYLRPLPAMKAARVSGQLLAALSPLIAGIAPLVSRDGEDNSIDVASIASALGALDENKLDSLIRALLFSYNNVSVEVEGKAVPMTEDRVNELFCGEVQNLFILCAYVIQGNFQSFFKNLSAQSGAQSMLRML